MSKTVLLLSKLESSLLVSNSAIVVSSIVGQTWSLSNGASIVCVQLHLDPNAIKSPSWHIWTDDVSSDSLAWIKMLVFLECLSAVSDKICPLVFS